MDVESNSQKRPFSWGRIETHSPALIISTGLIRNWSWKRDQVELLSIAVFALDPSSVGRHLCR